MLPKSRTPSEPSSALQRWEHTAFDGTPYCDEDLKAAQSTAHRIMVHETGNVLASVAHEAGLRFLSDEPIWFIDPASDDQKAFYGDLVFARGEADTKRITADDLLLVIEVVTTTQRKKEIKDTGFQRTLNEYNEVPEFGLVFPEANDPRSVRWFRLVDGHYEEIMLSPGAEVASSTIDGLVLRVRPQSEWEDGRKIDIYYKGVLRPVLIAERARAEKEKARADALADKLRELGVDPDSLGR